MIQRMERATHRGVKKQRCLGVIAGRSFSSDAWDLARKHRLMTVNFRQSFGEDALEALEEADRLIALVSSDREQLDASAEAGKLAGMIKDLKTNDVVVAVKSIAFEVLAALTMRDDGWENVGLGRDVPFFDPKTKDKTTRDVDVYGNKKGDLWIVECKAFGDGKEVTESEVRKFFHETVPSYIAWHRERRDPLKTCYAELWTTGVFSQDARKFFSEMKVQTAITAELREVSSIRGLFSPHSKGRCEDLLKAISSPIDKKGL